MQEICLKISALLGERVYVVNKKRYSRQKRVSWQVCSYTPLTCSSVLITDCTVSTINITCWTILTSYTTFGGAKSCCLYTSGKFTIVATRPITRPRTSPAADHRFHPQNYPPKIDAKLVKKDNNFWWVILRVKTMIRRGWCSGAGDRAFLRVLPAKSGSVGKSAATHPWHVPVWLLWKHLSRTV
jgi:hypothetical protein